MLCVECINKLKERLKDDEINILIYLSENNVISTHQSMSRETIQKGAELTIARTATSLHRLEAACFVTRCLFGKTHKYYITENGINVLKILEKEIN